MSKNENPLVRCPSCDKEYSKPLYDWQFIYCNDCGTYFEKHTGNKIENTTKGVPDRYWVKDA